MAAAMAMFYHEVITVFTIIIIIIIIIITFFFFTIITYLLQPRNDDLQVIAIQLGQHPGPDCPVRKLRKMNFRYDPKCFLSTSIKG